MNTFRTIFQDTLANRGRPSIQILLILFRLAQGLRGENPSNLRRLASAPAIVLYRSYAFIAHSVDLPASTRVGPSLRIYHGFGLVVNKNVRIGRDVTLRHSTTLGGKRSNTDCPVLEDACSIGPGTIIIGEVRVGKGATVGASSLVISDVLDGTVVAGAPARQVSERNAD